MPTTPAFSDISSHWAGAAIQALAERGVVSGYPDGRFRPEGTISRAEMAALMARIFPDAPAIREATAFGDVPEDFWAHAVIRWASERGFFSGYPDQTFRPFQRLPRVQALVVLVSGLGLVPRSRSIDVAGTALEDAAQIPAYAGTAVTAALQAKVVVNHPAVRRLRPGDTATRAEVVAVIAQALAIPEAVPPDFIAWRFQLQDLSSGTTVALADLERHDSLVREIQAHLREFRLYPGGSLIDGDFGPRSRAALEAFCQAMGLDHARRGVLDEAFASRMLSEDPVPFVIEGARDRGRIHQEFLRQEEGFDSSHLAFLDRGVKGSLFGSQRDSYPDRLRERPDQQDVIGMEEALRAAGRDAAFAPFPPRGQLPAISTTGLDFLHPDILQAVVCVGSVNGSELRARWLGRNALANVQCWSATKIIPLLHVISAANSRFPGIDIDTTRVRPRGSGVGYGFHDVAVDVISYGSAIGSSNSLSAMVKRFETPERLQGWLRDITGNGTLTFQGRYGEAPFLSDPELWDRQSGRVLLNSPNVSHRGENLISVYDVSRCLAMLGWHHHLPPAARLPGAQWDSLESMVRAMGTDTARYLDVALERLNLHKVIRSVVILSKLGFGRSASRDRTELVYSALIQFIDKRQWRTGQPAVHTTLAMTLLGARRGGGADQEAREIDARMAAEVTEILRRLLTLELV